MVLSDIFSSLAMVGIAGQQQPSLLALPRRHRYTACLLYTSRGGEVLSVALG